MKTALVAAIAVATAGVMSMSACGGSAASSCTGGTPTNVLYLWTCTSNCPDVADLDIASQSGSSVTGYITLCTGSGACPAFCNAGANSENSFTGTASGDCLQLTSTDGTWSAQGILNGNNMQFTISSSSGNCFGAQTQTVTLGH